MLVLMVDEMRWDGWLVRVEMEGVIVRLSSLCKCLVSLFASFGNKHLEGLHAC
jgi:hypothetical protein